jgi:1,4-dihydroxy-2-naphthoate octaprenyltransferase
MATKNHESKKFISIQFAQVDEGNVVQLPWRTLLQMTRPGFLVLSAVACLLGTAVAAASGYGPNVWTALITLMLAVLGLVGLFLGWAYSSPPLALMTRGLGEVTVAITWGLVVVGADYVQRGQFFVVPIAVAVSFAFLVGNILVINGFPDAAADAGVGKRTLVVRLGARVVAWVYLVIAVLAHVWLMAGVWLFILPVPALWGLASMPLSVWAFVLLIRNADQPSRLTPAIVMTIAAAVINGLAMSAGLLSLIL